MARTTTSSRRPSDIAAWLLPSSWSRRAKFSRLSLLYICLAHVAIVAVVLLGSTGLRTQTSKITAMLERGGGRDDIGGAGNTSRDADSRADGEQWTDAVAGPQRDYHHHQRQPPRCIVHALDNPIASTYADNTTGTINGTLAVVPISLELARSIIPPKWAILEHAYRELLPDFPQGMYPAIVQGVFDFDVQLKAIEFRMDDFQRIGFEFPFLDFLGDGHSSFRWAPEQLISADNDIAVDGSRHYGTVVHPASFDPPCNGYRQLPNGASYLKGYGVPERSEEKHKEGQKEKVIKAEGQVKGGQATRDLAQVALEFWPLASQADNPIPMAFWRNITNQPNFASDSVCGNMKRFFDTELSRGEFEPVFVRGKVSSSGFGPFAGDMNWSDAYGIQLNTAFIEVMFLECKDLKGYGGFDEAEWAAKAEAKAT